MGVAPEPVEELDTPSHAFFVRGSAAVLACPQRLVRHFGEAATIDLLSVCDHAMGHFAIPSP